MDDQAVIVTGMGAVTAQGVGLDASWEGITAMRDVLSPWCDAPESLKHLRVACCSPAAPLIPPGDLPPRFWKKLGRVQQLGAIAIDEALGHAGLPHDLSADPSERPVGLFLATTVCGMDQSEQFYAQYRVDKQTANDDLMRRVVALELVHFLGRRHRATGPQQQYMTTCVGSAMAIGAGMDYIASRRGDVAVVGGVEAMCRVVLGGFHALKLVAPDGCRPFDRNRPGITVGEGAGVLILESAAHARRRGAPMLAQIMGYAATSDAYHITAPEPTGKQAMRAIREALGQADLAPHQIDYINGHGTGTKDNDATESVVLRGVFEKDGSRQGMPAVSSTKRLTGHTFGAAGAIEAIICVQALREGVLPANVGSIEPDEACALPLVAETRRAKIDHALSCNFAFGGNNTALVIGRV